MRSPHISGRRVLVRSWRGVRGHDCVGGAGLRHQRCELSALPPHGRVGDGTVGRGASGEETRGGGRDGGGTGFLG